MLEVLAGDVTVHPIGLPAPVLPYQLGEIGLNQRRPQCLRKGNHAFEAGYPDIFNPVETGETFWQGGCGNNADTGVRVTLIFPCFGQPAILPTLGTLRLPENCSTDSATSPDNLLKNIPAGTADSNGLELVFGELAAQDRFKFQLLYFTLKLLRPLLALPPKLFDLLAHVVDNLVLLRQLQTIPIFLLLHGCRTDAVTLLIKATHHFQLQRLLLAFKCFALFANFEFHAP